MALVVLCLLVGCGSPGESAAPTDSPGDASSAEATEATEVATTPPIEPSPVAEVQPQPLKPRVEKRFTLDSPDWLGVGAGSLWVKLDVGLLTRIDPMTNAIVKHIKVAPRGAELCQGLSVVDDVIWTCGGDGGVVRVDPATNKVVARLPLGKATDQGTIPIVAGHAWFLIGDGSELYGVNNDTNEVDVKIPLDTRCVELAADDQSLWAMCVSDSQVLRIDPQTQEITDRITSLSKPRFAHAAEDLWVVFDGGIARIDRNTAEVTAALAVSATDGGLFATEDSVWVRRHATFLQHLDPVTGEMVEVLEGPEESGGSVLEAYGSVWATAFNDSVLYRIKP